MGVTSWHMSAIRLPEGDEVEEAWLSDAGWHEQPTSGAEDLPGRFALAGLVDAHSHVTFGPVSMGRSHCRRPPRRPTSSDMPAMASRSYAMLVAIPPSCSPSPA